MRIFIPFMIFCLVFLAGCKPFQAYTKYFKPVKPEKQARFAEEARVESPELAKLILRPQTTGLNVDRDPFKPLFTIGKKTDGVPKPARAVNDLEDLKYIGRVQSGGEQVILLKGRDIRGAYRLNDRVRDYRITEIDNEYVILSNGERSLTLKRGDER